jgi:hypothetical protein
MIRSRQQKVNIGQPALPTPAAGVCWHAARPPGTWAGARRFTTAPRAEAAPHRAVGCHGSAPPMATACRRGGRRTDARPPRMGFAGLRLRGQQGRCGTDWGDTVPGEASRPATPWMGRPRSLKHRLAASGTCCSGGRSQRYGHHVGGRHARGAPDGQGFGARLPDGLHICPTPYGPQRTLRTKAQLADGGHQGPSWSQVATTGRRGPLTPASPPRARHGCRPAAGAPSGRYDPGNTRGARTISGSTN